MARHRLAVVAALAVVAVECGGTLPAEVDPPLRAPVEVVAAPPMSFDAPPDAEVVPRSAPTPDPDVPLPATVAAVRPDVRVDDVPADAAERVRGVDGVEAVVQVASLDVAVPTRDGLQPVEALVVDHLAFRPFTPDVTANEVGVWQRLAEGNIIMTPAAANRVQAVLGETATLSGPRATEALRVGALAANGLPQLADVLLPPDVGHRLGAVEANTLLVAVADGADPAAVLTAVTSAVGGTGTVLEEPAPQRAAADAVGRTQLESFSYQSVGDGTIRIDPGWVNRWIVSVNVPILGRVTCHRAIVDQLAAALAELEAAGLGGEIYQYAGCWVPRHMLWDPARGISRHAWGLAFDINVPTNQYGAVPTLDMRIVETFRRWGFKWGGDFSTPDGMHFELERLIDL